MNGNLAKEVIEELLKSDCDLVVALRKSHLLAKIKNDVQMDNWILNELNGYAYDNDVIPDYRTIKGHVKARDVFGKRIPVFFENIQLEEDLSTRKIAASIPELLLFVNDGSRDVFMQYPPDVQKILNDSLSKNMNYEYILLIPKNSLSTIIEFVKTKLVDWVAMFLDNNQENDYLLYGEKEPIMIAGNNNTVSLKKIYNKIMVNTITVNQTLVNNIKKELDKDNITEEDKKLIIDMLEILTKSVNEHKDQKTLRHILTGIKDFMIGVGASIAAAFIQSKIG